MKKVLLGLVVVAFAFSAYQRVHDPAREPARDAHAETRPDTLLVELPEGGTKEDQQAFRCDGRTYCSDMHSCEEATYFLRNCPGMKMDGDNDGIPCEEQWCRN